jgi:hypothetical protein
MSTLKPTKKEQQQMSAWRNDPRMVFLANPIVTLPNGRVTVRDLTAKERAEWERNIGKYQLVGNDETI